MNKEIDSPLPCPATNQDNGLEKDVAVLITDMVQYSGRTSGMVPEQIRNFIIHYHGNLRDLIIFNSDAPIEFEPAAGDASVALFEDIQGEEKNEKCVRALQAAVRIVMAVEMDKLPETRIGIFSGRIIEAQVGKQTMKFGNSFTAARRLEELCDYFGTHILMDRDVARSFMEKAQFVVSIGKITPKNFKHPIHVYSVYLPGIHKCPPDIEKEGLLEFIAIKNQAMDFFSGNELKKITPNFAVARDKLQKAADLFTKISGREDTATRRVLDYISENPYPSEDFETNGMIVDAHKDDYRCGVRLRYFSQQLFKAMDYDFFNTLVINTEWEQYFRLKWHKKGKRIIRLGKEPEGIYYIVKGKVQIINKAGEIIVTLTDGDIFGKMACLSEKLAHTADMVAATDLVVKGIFSEDFEKFPVLKNIFNRILSKRSDANPLPPTM